MELFFSWVNLLQFWSYQWTVLVASIWLWSFTSNYTFQVCHYQGTNNDAKLIFPRPSLLRHSLWYEFDSNIRASCSVSACSQAIQLNKESGPGIRAWLKHFKLMYHFGFNFLYCSMNVKCEPNNVILNPRRKRWRFFPKCWQNIKDLNEMEGVVIRLYILSCILHLLIYWVMITYWMHCAFNLLSV